MGAERHRNPPAAALPPVSPPQPVLTGPGAQEDDVLHAAHEQEEQHGGQHPEVGGDVLRAAHCGGRAGGGAPDPPTPSALPAIPALPSLAVRVTEGVGCRRTIESVAKDTKWSPHTEMWGTVGGGCGGM